VNFRKENLTLVVTYDLIGEEGEEYEVELLYSASGGQVFDYEPKAISGDVGDDITPGLDKQITWNVLQDFPNGIQSASVKFKVVADEEGGAFGWFLATLLAGSGGTAAGIATGVLPCFSFIPGQISNKLCPAPGDGTDPPEPPPTTSPSPTPIPSPGGPPSP
jgi:hypothetical protein